MIKPPCISCPETGCGAKHDTCEKYMEYKEQVNAIRRKKKHISTMNYLARPPQWRKREEGKWR